MNVMLANKMPEGKDPAGFWMSEKLDGVRAVWDGEAFLSRNGKKFAAPAEVVAAMPKGVVLDGELFMGRGKFQATVSNARRGDWSGISFMVFDIIGGGSFEARQSALAELDLPGFCERVQQVECAGEDHLAEFEGRVLAAGGEGVILRAAGSKYENGRSWKMLKVKRFDSDEAVVVGHERSENGLASIVAAVNGSTFRMSAGMSDDERMTPPAVGSRVTFSFFGFTDGGKPRHPVFVGVRDYE